MDSLDIKIMRELMTGEAYSVFIYPRKPLRTIARKLGIDKDTLRNRIKRFRGKGLLLGWSANANPNLLGVRMTTLLFNVPSPSSKPDAIRKIKLIPGVFLIDDFYGNSMTVSLYYETDESLKKTTELVSRISNTESLLRFDTHYPGCSISLTKTDWNIIRSLQKNPGKPYGQLAAELGLSSRTVKRRLSRLIEGMALGVIPNFNMKAIDGTLVNMPVSYSSPKQNREASEKILGRFDGRLVRADLTGENHACFNLIITNVAETEDISKWMDEQSGITSYRIDLVQNHLEMWDAFHELIERKLGQIQVLA